MSDLKEITALKQEYFRAEAVDYLKRLLFKPYVWGGNDPLAGFDCSGLIIEVLQAHGILKRGTDYTAEGIWKKLEEHTVVRPHAGVLVFFIDSTLKATHVGMMIDDYFMIHASGGGRYVIDFQDAVNQDAYIKKDLLVAEISRRRRRSSLKKVQYIDPFRAIQ